MAAVVRAEIGYSGPPTRAFEGCLDLATAAFFFRIGNKVCNIVHLIYRAQPYEGIAKDFEFSRRTMEEHWQTGYSNARQTLTNPEVLELPDRLEGVRTFDIGEERA
jgi:hypothetical protein